MNNLIRATIQEALHLIDVFIQDGHQIAGALIFKIRHVQFLYMVIGIQPQIMLQILGQLAPLE